MPQAADHLYVHVPFCDGKCVYCAFYSELYRETKADRFMDALAREMDLTLSNRPRPSPQTVYVGGGTPSILPERQLAALCDLILNRISRARLKEWTLEANPGTLTPAKLDILKNAGVNRISIGAQSFNPSILKAVGRRHSADAIASTLDAVRAAGFDNAGLDLIAALPDVNNAGWRRTLDRALALNPSHLSVYALTVEEPSLLARLVRSGRATMPNDNTVLAALQMAEDRLTRAGYRRYEISNYARPGQACLHNISCWRGEDYLGFGPAASSRSGLARWTNASSLAAYAAALAKGRRPPRDEEALAPATDAAERFIFRFRLLEEGVHLRKACRRLAGVSPALIRHWELTLARLSDDRLVEYRAPAWFLTPLGATLADRVAAELLP